MKFLGSTWPRLVDWVTESVADVASAHRRFETSMEGLGAFPSARRARVLWAALSDPGGTFVGIAQALDRVLAREFKAEKRPFTPHLTVARFDPMVSLGDDLAASDVTIEAFGVHELVLYRSFLQRPAPRYEALGRFPLGARGLEAGGIEGRDGEANAEPPAPDDGALEPG
jgi:RNA 2',3'-cyclic 3'-phosphodiesterase